MMEEEGTELLSEVKIEIDVAEEPPQHTLWTTDPQQHDTAKQTDCDSNSEKSEDTTTFGACVKTEVKAEPEHSHDNYNTLTVNDQPWDSYRHKTERNTSVGMLNNSKMKVEPVDLYLNQFNTLAKEYEAYPSCSKEDAVHARDHILMKTGDLHDNHSHTLTGAHTACGRNKINEGDTRDRVLINTETSFENHQHTLTDSHKGYDSKKERTEDDGSHQGLTMTKVKVKPERFDEIQPKPLKTDGGSVMIVFKMTVDCFNDRASTALPKQDPVKCDVCNKSFSNVANLKRHKLLHTGQKSYPCDVCNKAFTQAGHLKTHKMIHSGQKLHVCDQCPKSFPTAGYLKNHKVQVHTKQKPHVCDVCKKSFITPSKLKLHQQAHIGQEPHVCDVCKETFSTASALRKHGELHLAEKLDLCDVCNRVFSRVVSQSCPCVSQSESTVKNNDKI